MKNLSAKYFSCHSSRSSSGVHVSVTNGSVILVDATDRRSRSPGRLPVTSNISNSFQSSVKTVSPAKCCDSVDRLKTLLRSYDDGETKLSDRLRAKNSRTVARPNSRRRIAVAPLKGSFCHVDAKHSELHSPH
jgi:hypothetical protein